MTTEEFSNQFDILYNNIDSNQAPGLNTYEKSVFLTQAQDEIVVSLYKGTEVSEEIRRYLDTLIRTEELTNITNSDLHGMTAESKFYALPDEVMYITAEFVSYVDNNDRCKTYTAEVQPVKQDEFARIKNNPFRGPTKHRLLRLDYGPFSTYKRVLELVPKKGYGVGTYIIRFISNPEPIIIGDISNTNSEYTGLSLTIKGEDNHEGTHHNFECKLPEAVHETVLQRAVAMAKAAWSDTTQSTK